MADLLQAWMLTLSNDGVQVAKAREMLAGMDTRGLSQREAAHLAALKLAANGQWHSAVAVLDRHLLDDPHDLAGHQ